MAEKKAVLNVTVSESLAEDVRRTAKLEHTTISSVVERALREVLAWERTRQDGIRAIHEYFEEHGYPTPEEMAEAEARVDEEHRLIDEARAAMAARDHAAKAEGGGVA
jgi:predicted transcriptional regulator